MKILSRSLVIFLLILMTACGYHLRGFFDMPAWLNDVGIVLEKGHRDLPNLLQQQLEAYKVNVVPLSEARYILIIKNDQYRQEIMSVSSTTTPRQYQVFYSVHFVLQEAKGKMLIPAGIVEITRQITINSDRILGSDEEETLIKKEMREDAVLQIINRLSKLEPN
ncbi:Rare lipoprotein B (plasmid) [Legionella adelaidensis]|uniref:LPS-assembly lipoprotein LptE n=1 Tax=Legionella adelaidensis TaxID=45056 RepID=A0A0W0R464_9GAMM|nr:LPS assembly lipoprotein LptE [Legionella adelaidensis]KTC65862.1 rare lipoprotein B [Legionella adelaidensis]VEH85292.1 Rare lipoprotein B [Legionella adelaidensis]